MPTYFSGDIQGCFRELENLLELISFDPKKDRLGFVGDLINRGPQSLETLRFISKQKNPIVVLGNHDFNLMAIYFGVRKSSNHSLEELLNAPDLENLVEWLMQQPLMIQTENYVVVHAGIPPQWSIKQAQTLADEAITILRENPKLFLEHIYGNQPDLWHDNLSGWDRYRYIINACTRMRFCDQNGRLDLQNTTAHSDDKNLKPWFDWRTNDNKKTIFGHWASLEGNCQKPNFYALDTGCIWGNKLTALRIDDWQLFSVPAP